MYNTLLGTTCKMLFINKNKDTIYSLFNKNHSQTNFVKNLPQITEISNSSRHLQNQNFAFDSILSSELLRVKSLPQQYLSTNYSQSQEKPHQFITQKFHKNEIANRVKQNQYAANKPIEDKIISAQLDSIDAYTVSVFDGHGGDQLSKYAYQKINEFINLNINKQIKNKKHNKESIEDVIKNSIKKAYVQIQNCFFESYQGMLQLSNNNLASVGSCGITVLVHNNKIYVANLGDSQAIIITQNEGNYNFIKGNERHSVTSSSQRKIIQQKFLGKDNNVITKDQKGRYYVKGRLQPTRCLGDYYLKKQKYYKKFCGSDEFHGPYIQHQPQISVFQIEQDFRFVVVASDGIWDFLTKWDVVKIIAQTQIKSKNLQKQENKDFDGDQSVDLSKTYIQFSNEDETVQQKLIQQVLKKCSKNRKINVKELKNIKEGQKRNYFDDITVGIINLQGQI